MASKQAPNNVLLQGLAICVCVLVLGCNRVKSPETSSDMTQNTVNQNTVTQPPKSVLVASSPVVRSEPSSVPASESMESRALPPPSPEEVATKLYEDILAIAQPYLSEPNENQRDAKSDSRKLKSMLEELISLTLETPDCLIAQEALGSATFAFVAIDEVLKKDTNSSSRSKFEMHPYDADTLRVYCWKASRKAADLGSTSAATYHRLACLKLHRTGGRWQDAELIEYLLESIKLDPESGVNIGILSVALLNSNFLESEQFDLPILMALTAQKGSAKKEVRRIFELLEKDWDSGQFQAERAAILGHIDYEAQRDLMRHGKLKALFQLALENHRAE